VTLHVDPSINLSIIIEFFRRFELSWRLLLLSSAEALIENRTYSGCIFDTFCKKKTHYLWSFILALL